jgi:NagD protein
MTGPNSAAEQAILSKIRHVCLDMDGTIYKGSDLFPYTKDFLARLDDMGIGYTFLTNNSSKSVEAYLEHLRKMGIETTRDKMYTSGLATMDFLRHDYPGVKRVYILGTPSLKQEFVASGFEVMQAADDEPDAVVVGFDTTLTFEHLCECAWWIAQGKPFIATHPDLVCPTNLPTVLVDCGAVCRCLEAATGRKVEAVPGKPDPRMLEGIMRRHGLEPQETAMVGDRLYTDVAMANNAGAVGVLVLTGEATRADAEASADVTADFVLESIQVLGDRLAAAR